MFKFLGVAFAVFSAGAIGLAVGLSQSQAPRTEAELLETAQSFSAEPAEQPVSDGDLQLYIDVYKAMQSDHSLDIEQAIAGREISIDNFRQLERRIQGKTPLVEKVRAALLEHAKQQAVFAFQDSPEAADTKAKVKPKP